MRDQKHSRHDAPHPAARAMLDWHHHLCPSATLVRCRRVAGDAYGGDQFPYPNGSVVGGFLDDSASGAARERLDQAGFGPNDYQVLHGEDDAGRLDTTGEAHGRMGRIVRRLQDAVTDEGDLARRYSEYLHDGHYLIGVRVGDDEAAKQRAAAALHQADPEFLTYYAAHYIEDLSGT